MLLQKVKSAQCDIAAVTVGNDELGTCGCSACSADKCPASSRAILSLIKIEFAPHQGSTLILCGMSPSSALRRAKNGLPSSNQNGGGPRRLRRISRRTHCLNRAIFGKSPRGHVPCTSVMRSRCRTFDMMAALSLAWLRDCNLLDHIATSLAQPVPSLPP